MKFPRNARLLRNQLDATPFAAVFFLLVIFLMLGAMIPTPGLPLRLPVAENVPGTDKPTVTVAVDASNQLYFANQIISEADLISSLRVEVASASEPLTLVVQADKTVTFDQLVRLRSLALKAGMQEVLWATQPRASPASGAGALPPP